MNNKKLLAIALPVLIVSIILIVYCVLLTRVNKVSDLVNLDSVNKVVLMDGSNGNYTDVNDEKEMDAIIKSLDKLELKRYHGEDSTGWVFAIILKTNNSEYKITFQGVERCVDDNGNEYIIKNADDNLKNLSESYLN